MMKLNDVHELALNILEETGDARYTNLPSDYAGKDLWQDYYKYRAHKAAYKALHERDRTRANTMATAAVRHLSRYKELQ